MRPKTRRDHTACLASQPGNPLTALLCCWVFCSVSVRVRPLNRQEQSEGFAWRVENNAMCQVDPVTQEPDRVRDVRYMLDHIFSPKQSTREIYATTTQSLIHKLVHGFNSTVFAYGQTSSGKTHTMRGTPDEPGIIPMAVQEVFSLIEQSQDREFLLRVSYMEVRVCVCGSSVPATTASSAPAPAKCLPHATAAVQHSTVQWRHRNRAWLLHWQH